MSTSITTGMMNTPLLNLAGKSAVNKDPGSDPPPPDFSDSDTNSECAFSLHGASDSDSSDIQRIKPSAEKPTLDLATVPVWDQNISTRNNAQAIKISLGSAGYLDTTKGKGTHQEQLILLAAAHGQWTFEYVAINYLISGLHPAHDHIVDATISATNVNKRLATIISHAQQQCLARRHANGLRLKGDTAPPSTMNNPSYGQCQRAPAERHVNDNYTHNMRNDYKHQNSPQRQQYWPTQSDNDDLQRHHQPFGFVSPAGHHHHGHHPANNDSDQQPTGGQEAYPLMDIRNCGNNVAAIKLADPGPFSGCRIYNPATGRKTPPLSMPALQFSNADYQMDAFQPSGQQEGPHAPPPMLPSAALASAQEGPPPPHHNEQHPPHHQEGDATALSAPHTSKHAQLTSHYVDLNDYHPTLVASAIAAVVSPRSARLTALALPAPIVRVSTAPRNYQEDISSTRPDNEKKSMNHEINSITSMALFVWHEDGNIIKREAGVIVRGNLLTTGETYAYEYLPLGCGRKDGAWHPVEASKAWFLCFSSFLHDFGFIGSEPGGVIHLHRETCINDILTTSHVTESKPRRLPRTLNINFHNPAVTYRAQGRPSSPTELLELYKDRVYDANIASALRRHQPVNVLAVAPGATSATGPAREAAAPRITFAKDVTRDLDAEANAPWRELMRGSIEALYGTDNWGAKVLDLLTTSPTANTYSNYEGTIRLFAEFCIDKKGISPLDCTKATCIRYLAWIAERGTIDAGSGQPYLCAINTFLRHIGRDDAPAAGPAIMDMKRALGIRQRKTNEELRCALCRVAATEAE
eukprot:jgi/Tetstr1/425205/TSEL_015666.t1